LRSLPLLSGRSRTHGQANPQGREQRLQRQEIIAERQRFIEETTGAELNHTKRYSFDPEEMAGNIESLFGVAQVPIGLAGPLLIHGEHAQGEFYVPMATVEGTMLASYNRGMKVIRESGGVTTTVVGKRCSGPPASSFAARVTPVISNSGWSSISRRSRPSPRAPRPSAN
jgi:hydroxymethylglutaryl-CoA reductase